MYVYFFITDPIVTLKLSPCEYVNSVQRKTIWTGFGVLVFLFFFSCALSPFLIDYTINQFICKGYKHRINFISTFANVALNILGTLLQKKGEDNDLAKVSTRNSKSSCFISSKCVWCDSQPPPNYYCG